MYPEHHGDNPFNLGCVDADSWTIADLSLDEATMRSCANWVVQRLWRFFRNNHIYGIVRAFVDHVGPSPRTELDRIARNVWEAEAARKGRPRSSLIAGNQSPEPPRLTIPVAFREQTLTVFRGLTTETDFGSQQ
jgi:hypothetical protein